MMRTTFSAFALAVATAFNAAAAAAAPVHAGAECIVPSKPGGGFDLTCKLIRKGLAQAGEKDDGLRISYLPGGIGAVAWSMMASQRRAEPDTLVAFSGGSLLNLALGKFGRAAPADVRWVAGIGADYGMVAVREDAPWRNLGELVDAIRRDPSKVSIGGGGTLGSQDWIKMATLVRQRSGDPKSLRYVAFEGGGEAFTALAAGHVQVVSGDVSEAALHLGAGGFRVLAVMADARLPGTLAAVPTAREQGFDISWPIIRGVYMGPQVAEADYRKWVGRFDHMLKDKRFEALRAAHGLYPFAMTGNEFTAYITKTVDDYGKQVKELGLVR